MNKTELLLAVAASVESTPAELLTSGSVLKFNGCRCAIGAYGYDHVPGFKELADTLLAQEKDDEGDATDETYAEYDSQVDALTKETYRQIDEILSSEGHGAGYIYGVNDRIFSRASDPTEARIVIAATYREMARSAIIDKIGTAA